MAENSYGVVVTEGMLIEAAGAGDLESLTVWARQGVRVTSGEPLYAAVCSRRGHLEVLRCLVRKLGADVNQAALNQRTPLIHAAFLGNLAVAHCLIELGADVNQTARHGETPLIAAAAQGSLAVVRCLIELGARVAAVDNSGDTALLESALNGRYAVTQYLLEEAGANIQDVTNDGETLWDHLGEHLGDHLDDDDDEVEANSDELTALLRVMVLRGAPPPALVALLSPEPARVVQEGARLRARLPAYLAHRRAYLDSRCPRISLLPGVLRALIYGFEGPATTEELWATGLGTVQ
jgi:hypothetical protein